MAGLHNLVEKMPPVVLKPTKEGEVYLLGLLSATGTGILLTAIVIVVASTATRWFNREGNILRDVFFHSIALASLVDVLVTLQANVFPFTLMVVR